MRLAWFRPDGIEARGRLDDVAHLIAGLRARHTIDLIDEAGAHAFVHRHARAPWDLCVYEPGNRDRDRYVWPYLFHYPGVLVLRHDSLNDGRAAALERQGRPERYTAEFVFNQPAGSSAPPPIYARRGRWPMLRAPLAAALMTVVPDADLARTLAELHPDACIRNAPIGLPGPSGEWAAPGLDPALPVVGVIGTGRLDVINRATARARTLGARLDLRTGESLDTVLREADIVLALGWPDVSRAIPGALASLADGRAVVVIEAERTAAWPALDPQTWEPRHRDGQAAIVVSIDPRDEEHSLMLTLRRLAGDPALRASLGSAGQTWWRAHATVEHAVTAWTRLLEDAAARHVPPRPAGWPAHLDADGTADARAILAEFGVAVDLF